MIDTAFVRENFALVEEKLRARGMNPATVLGDFATIDRERRNAITEVETLKAFRNKQSEEVGRLKRSSSAIDVAQSVLEQITSLLAQTNTVKDKIAELEAKTSDADRAMRRILESIPNLPQDSVPVGKD